MNINGHLPTDQPIVLKLHLYWKFATNSRGPSNLENQGKSGNLILVSGTFLLMQKSRKSVK